MVDQIGFAGVSWNLLSITVYLGSVLIITGFFKERLKPKTWQKKVLLSWMIGVPVFFTIGIFRPDQVTFAGIVQYFFITLILNGAYKGSTLLWDFLASKFPFIVPRRKNNGRKSENALAANSPDRGRRLRCYLAGRQTAELR
jgi:hypothetical protein